MRRQFGLYSLALGIALFGADRGDTKVGEFNQNGRLQNVGTSAFSEVFRRALNTGIPVLGRRLTEVRRKALKQLLALAAGGQTFKELNLLPAREFAPMKLDWKGEVS